MDDQYLDDFKTGDRFESPELAVSEDDIRAFAALYDPQPFHLDRASAKASPFQELVGSGWHTPALTMRLLVQSRFRPAGGILGFGVDELRWPSPLKPGDRIQARVEVLEVRPSTKNPDRGVLRVRVETVNQEGAILISFMPLLRVSRRNKGG